MRKFVPYMITAVVAVAAALAVSYFVSHSKFMSHSNIVVSIGDGEKRGWTKHYTGGGFLKRNPKTHHGSKWPQFWGRGPEGVENALVKLTVAKEKGLLSEEEYEKAVSVLIGPMLGVKEVEVDIDIKTRIIEHDSDSEEHDSDNDDGDE
jgi:hypothetical protein